MMNYPRVLCLGEILWDCLADQLGRDLSTVESWTAYPGGAPANVACALVKLGTPAAFIGCVGQDRPGRELVELLEKIGVNTTGVQYHQQAPTRQVYVLRSLTGDREFAGFGNTKTTEFADTYLQASHLPVELFKNADYLVLGTLEMAYPDSHQAIEEALNLANLYQLKIVVDVNWRPMFWSNINQAKALILQLIKKIDILKLSQEEADWLFETTDATAIYYRLNSCQAVLVTAGEDGCNYCFGEQQGKLSAPRIKVVDTTGAGDGFLAGFIHQLCQRDISSLKNPEIAKDIIAYGCAVGALTTTKPGAIAAQPSADEVEIFLKTWP